MLPSEFTARTGVELSGAQFWAMHEQYMQSDMNKDDFCASWMRARKRMRLINAVACCLLLCALGLCAYGIYRINVG